MVLVPGLGLSVGAMASTAARLRSACRTLCLPGHGLAASADTDVSPAASAARVRAYVVRQRLTHVVLVGHSASCQAVVEAAGHAGVDGRVAGLVLLGPTTDPRASSWPLLGMRWLRTAVHEPLRQAPLLIDDYRRTGVASMYRTMDAARAHRIDEAVRRVRCPVLVVRGPRDRISPQRWTEELGTAVTLRAGAHMAVLTHPAEVAAVVQRFVDGLHLRGGAASEGA